MRSIHIFCMLHFCCHHCHATTLIPFSLWQPEGRLGMSDVSPLSESQGCHLIPLCYLLSCSSALSCYPFCLIVFCLLALFLNFFQKILQYFSLRDKLFLYGSCLAVGRRQLVGGMCSMLPYDTGICCYAFI